MSERRKTIVAFGELMLRLNPVGHERIVQASVFEARYTGAEVNAAVLMASLGVEARAVSRVPPGEVGQACLNYLSRFGINVEHVVRGGDRLGLFYLEAGASERPSKVIYDRAHSAFHEANPSDYDWRTILEGADWFHFSGTAPALSESVRKALKSGLHIARERGITVSCDLNYRARLWGLDEAREVMTDLMPYVNVLIGNEEDATKVFDLDVDGGNVNAGELNLKSYEAAAAILVQKFGFKYVATSLRTSMSASVNGWNGILFDGQQHYQSRAYTINPVIDRVGSGDAFAGGVIYGLLNTWPAQQCVDFAAAASCLKHSIPGDFALLSRHEIDALMAGDSSGRVQR